MILGLERSMKWKMATHSCILSWNIPWTEAPDWLQSMWSPGVRYDWALEQQSSKLSLFPKISPRSFLCHLHLIKTTYQRIVDLLWCVNFRCKAMSIIHIYIYTHIYTYTHTHITFFFRFFSHISYWRILNRILCAIQ